MAHVGTLQVVVRMSRRKTVFSRIQARALWPHYIAHIEAAATLDLQQLHSDKLCCLAHVLRKLTSLLSIVGACVSLDYVTGLECELFFNPDLAPLRDADDRGIATAIIKSLGVSG